MLNLGKLLELNLLLILKIPLIFEHIIEKLLKIF
jgi:hypothetical protein